MSATCPKCRHERPAGAQACPRCGLLVSRWAQFAATPVSSVLDQPWRALEQSWDDPAAHSRFLELAANADALDLAAACYRSRRDAAPSDARAATGLERAAAMAAQLHVARAQADRPDKTLAVMKSLGTMAAAMALAVAVWLVIVAMSHHGQTLHR